MREIQPCIGRLIADGDRDQLIGFDGSDVLAIHVSSAKRSAIHGSPHRSWQMHAIALTEIDGEFAAAIGKDQMKKDSVT